MPVVPPFPIESPPAPQRGSDPSAVYSSKADVFAAWWVALPPAMVAWGQALLDLAEEAVAGVASVNGESGVLVGYVKTTGAQTLADKTLAAPILYGALREEQAAIVGTTPAISPADGTVRHWTLTANSTPTKGAWNDGESLTLHLADGPAAAVNWTSMAITWVSGSAPALPTSGWAVIELWRLGGVLYGAYAGAAA